MTASITFQPSGTVGGGIDAGGQLAAPGFEFLGDGETGEPLYFPPEEGGQRMQVPKDV